MSTIVSDVTVQLSSGALPGIAAMILLAALLLEIEIVRVNKPEAIKSTVGYLRVAVIPLAMVFVFWMLARFIHLFN